MTISSGAILRDRYRLEASIGRGGMGEVFEATDLSSGQKFAVKVVRRAFVDELLMARLHREAEAARRIQSECVPYLFEVDYTDEGELFLVMELLQGETLGERLRRKSEPLTWDEVRGIGEDVLRGLIDAHAAGVIHRDLKPGNIFLEGPASGGGEQALRAKVLDFGVCKLDTHDGESLTSTGEAVGTISYMAPEQIRGASHVDERADVYSFATVIFEALSGRLAHDASGQIAMIASKLERPARNLRDCARVPTPPGVEQLLARCLSRKPAERPSTAIELLRLWRALGAPTQAPRPSGGALPVDSGLPTETVLTAAPVTRIEQRSARVGFALAACALVASSVVLVIGLRLRGGAPAAAGQPRDDSQGGAAIPADTSPNVAVLATAPATGSPRSQAAPIASSASSGVDAGSPKSATRGPKSSVPSRAGGGAKAPPQSGPQLAAEPRY